MANYETMPIQKLREEVVKLENRKLRVAQQMEDGKISEEYAQEVYEPISQEWTQASLILRIRENELYDIFVHCFKVE